MIIRGGFNIYPGEVEEEMIQHEAVSLVEVIGIPHEEMGEEAKAFVVLKESHSVAASDGSFSFYPTHMRLLGVIF